MPSKKAKLLKIRLITIPNTNMSGGCEPHFRIKNGENEYYTQDDIKPPSLNPSNGSIYELKLPKPLEVENDVLIECYSKGLVGKGEKIFHFWFNTSFLRDDDILIINKNMIDKAYHDKGNKNFDKNFRVELEFSSNLHGVESPNFESSDKENKLLQRILKMTDEMPFNYSKLSLL